jgi:S-formylglutathione hydrolase FrmB
LNIRIRNSGLYLAAPLLAIARRRVPPLEPDRPRLPAGVKTQDISFHSSALNRQVTYRVILPVDVPAARTLPVVYLLHGTGNDFRTWSNHSDIAEYARKGLILVMPWGDLSFYVNAVGAKDDKYEDYTTRDLIADVESRFPARHDREGRAIIGASMGGYGAVYYALKHPELYAFAGALSPAVDAPSRRFGWRQADQWRRFRRVFGPEGSSERRALDPFMLLQTADPKATPYIHLTAGEQESFLDPVRRFAAQLEANGFAYDLHITRGGHCWAEWNAQLPACFARLFEALAANAD